MTHSLYCSLFAAIAVLLAATVVPRPLNAFVFVPGKRIVADDHYHRRATATEAASGTGALFASSSGGDTAAFRAQREELKRQLLKSADEFKSIQSDLQSAVAEDAKTEADAEGKTSEAQQERGYYMSLLRRIMSKIMGRKKKKKPRRILGSESFGTLRLEVGEVGNNTIAIAEQLATLNPTPHPTRGFQGYDGVSPDQCKLAGTWKLRFTTAADATFAENPKRGKAITSQEIDAVAGTLTNVVDFERGKTKGFRVVVAGRAVSDTEIELTFRRVVIFRNSKWFKKIIIPIPTKLFRLLNRIASRGRQSKNNKRGPYFQLQYLDDNLRMHKTGEGNWFIQSRLE